MKKKTIKKKSRKENSRQTEEQKQILILINVASTLIDVNKFLLNRLNRIQIQHSKDGVHWSNLEVINDKMISEFYREKEKRLARAKT